MYNVELIKDKFDVHRIFSANGSYMEVIPERGGLIARLGFKGYDVLYLDRETLMDTSKNVRGGIPVLFPICGYLKDGKYTIGEKEYYMKQHGFARLLPWKTENTEIHEDHGSITIGLEDNNYTYSIYPFHFKLSYQYTINEDSLVIESTYVNRDEKDMPFYAGFHPYFSVSSKEDIEISIPSEKYIESVEKSILGGRIDFSRDEVNAAYYSMKKNSCYIKDRHKKTEIDINFGSAYKYIVVWSLKGKDFVCVEPWTAYVDAMNTGKDKITLQSGKSMSTQVNIKFSRY